MCPKVFGAAYMGSNTKDGGGQSGGSSSDDLLSLLRRLQESVSGLSEAPGANGVPGASAVTPFQSLEEQREPTIYLEHSTDISENDASKDVIIDHTESNSRGSFPMGDKCATDKEEIISGISGASTALELEAERCVSQTELVENHDAVEDPGNESGDIGVSVMSEDVPVEDSESATASSEVSTLSENESPADLSQNWQAVDGQSERPERYANPTRTIPLGGGARNRQRVLSNSNLVGAPPPQAQVGGYRLQQRPGERIKDILKDPVVAVVVLIALMVIVIVAASVPFIFSGSTELQRAVPLPSVSVVHGVDVASEEPSVLSTQDGAVEEFAPSESGNVVPVDQAIEEGKVIEKQPEVILGEQSEGPAEVKVEEQGEISGAIVQELVETGYRWIIEIAAVTKQSDYERIMIQLQKDGFHPLVRVDNLPSGIEVFRLEIRESEMNNALVRMSQLKRLKYIDPKDLVIKPANDQKK
jgi:hypothetical protein